MSLEVEFPGADEVERDGAAEGLADAGDPHVVARSRRPPAPDVGPARAHHGQLAAAVQGGDRPGWTARGRDQLLEPALKLGIPGGPGGGRPQLHDPLDGRAAGDRGADGDTQMATPGQLLARCTAEPEADFAAQVGAEAEAALGGERAGRAQAQAAAADGVGDAVVAGDLDLGPAPPGGQFGAVDPERQGSGFDPADDPGLVVAAVSAGGVPGCAGGYRVGGVPDVPVGAGDDVVEVGGIGELDPRDTAARGHPGDFAGCRGEPEAAVGPGGKRPREDTLFEREPGVLAARVDPAQRSRLVAVLGDPEIAVGAEDDFDRASAGRQLEHLDRARRVDPADLVFPRFGEPDVAFGAEGDTGRVAARPRQIELRHVAARRHPVDRRHRPALAADRDRPVAGEPEVAVGAGEDRGGGLGEVGAELFFGHREVGDIAAGRQPVDPAGGGQPDVAVGADRHPFGSFVRDHDADLALLVDPHDLRQVVGLFARIVDFRVVPGEPDLPVGAEDQRAVAAGGRYGGLREGRHPGARGDRRGAGRRGGPGREREQDDRADRHRAPDSRSSQIPHPRILNHALVAE